MQSLTNKKIDIDKLAQSFDNDTSLEILNYISSKIKIGATPKQIREYLNQFMEISHQTIYTTCKKMLEKELIKRQYINNKESRYLITKLGARIRLKLLGDDFKEFFKSNLLINYLSRFPNLSKTEIEMKIEDSMEKTDRALKDLQEGKLSKVLADNHDTFQKY